SPSMNNLRKPDVAILAGRGVSNLEVGEVWHQLDQRYEMPITILDKHRVGGNTLSRYNTLVMVNGNYGDLSNGAVEGIKEWVRDGGTLIVQRNAINWARREGLKDVEPVERESTEQGRVPYADLSATRGAQVLGGSIFSGKIDVTNPLGYGFRSEDLHIFRNSTNFLQQTSNLAATPLWLTDEPLVSGYISDENLEIIGGTASVIVSSYGSGRVIAFVDNPNFRAFWYGTNKLFANAVFFGNTISWQATN
ncbi:MAG: zinc carboxypeptidase, partial [Balneolaceae bacterium]|nr:zinc carboxypeptidase [Balneolaceae bacterium]